MPRRESDCDISAPITPRERLAIDEMKSMLGLASDANLVRLALYRLGRHLEARIDPALFRLRVHAADPPIDPRTRKHVKGVGPRARGIPAGSVKLPRGGSA